MKDLLEITDEDIQKRQSAVSTLLSQMKVPGMRTDTTRLSNIRWLLRNLRIENKDHPMLPTTTDLLKWLHKHMEKS